MATAFRPLQESTRIYDCIILLIFIFLGGTLSQARVRLDSRRAHHMPDIAIAFLVGCALGFGVGYGVREQMSRRRRRRYGGPT